MADCTETTNYYWKETDLIRPGVFSKVYKGYCKNSQKEVSIKVYDSEQHSVYSKIVRLLSFMNPQSKYIARFLAEEEVLNSSHEKRAIVKGFAERTVRAELKKAENRSGLPKPSLLKLIKHCAKALKYLDERHISHKNIRPENILMFSKPKVLFQLNDYGLYSPDDEDEQTMDTTASGALEGFNHDLWLAACTFFECATGKIPFGPPKGRLNMESLEKLFEEMPDGATWSTFCNETGKYSFHHRLPTRQHSDYTKKYRPILAKFFALLFEKDWTFLNAANFLDLCQEFVAIAPRQGSNDEDKEEHYDLSSSKYFSGDLSLYCDEEIGKRNRKFGKYVWNERDGIGKGRHSRVYRGRDTETKEYVAVKVCIPARSMGKNYNEKISLLRNFQCPYIVQCLADGEIEDSDGEYVIIMEYADCNLRQQIQTSGCLDYSVFITFVNNFVSALEYLDEKMVAHRDLKPENVLVFKRPNCGRVFKLCDFNFSCRLKSWTETMSLDVGTSGYKPPAQLRKRKYDVAFGNKTWEYTKDERDLPPAAFCIFECATGRRPFPVPDDRLAEVYDNREPDTVCVEYDKNTEAYTYLKDLPPLNNSYPNNFRPLLRKFFQLLFSKNDGRFLTMRMFSVLCHELTSKDLSKNRHLRIDGDNQQALYPQLHNSQF